MCRDLLNLTLYISLLKGSTTMQHLFSCHSMLICKYMYIHIKITLNTYCTNYYGLYIFIFHVTFVTAPDLMITRITFHIILYMLCNINYSVLKTNHIDDWYSEVEVNVQSQRIINRVWKIITISARL